MFKAILLILVVAVAGFLFYANSQPSEFTVTRSATINASESEIFDKINDLNQWNAWSPWKELDPNQTVEISTPAIGQDAKMSWAGNFKVGAGSMTITDSKPNESVKFNLDFTKPFKAAATSEFDLKSENGQTTVTWSMSGNNNLLGKAISLIFNCEKMTGEQFDKGLNNLKGLLENKA